MYNNIIEECKKDLVKFCETFFPDLKLTQQQKVFIKTVEKEFGTAST